MWDTLPRYCSNWACISDNLSGKRQTLRTIWMYYGSATSGCGCIYAWQKLCVHSSDSSTFLPEMTSWPPSWKYDIILEIYLRQLMCTVFTWKLFCQISSWSELKWRSLRLFFKTVTLTRTTRRTRWIAIRDQFLIEQYGDMKLSSRRKA